MVHNNYNTTLCKRSKTNSKTSTKTINANFRLGRVILSPFLIGRMFLREASWFFFWVGGWVGGGHVLFQFLCNLQQYCNSAYNKLNSLQQKEFINITKMNYIWRRKKREEREGDKHTCTHACTRARTHARTHAHTHKIPN